MNQLCLALDLIAYLFPSDVPEEIAKPQGTLA